MGRSRSWKEWGSDKECLEVGCPGDLLDVTSDF